MNPMRTAEQQLGLALQQNDAQHRMIVHISEQLAAMEEAGKIGDEIMQLLTVVRNTHTCPVHRIALLSSDMELNNS
jgi:hemerythrin